jgi:hypothetical protein
MDESLGRCSFLPCSQQAVVTLRLLVDGRESEVPTCPRHAKWVRGYVEEDAAVRLVHEVPGRSSPTTTLSRWLRSQRG